MPKYKSKPLSKIKKVNHPTLSPYFDKTNEIATSTSTEKNKITKNKEKDNMVQRNYFGENKIRKTFNFFNQNCIHLAKSLLGQLIVRKVNEKRTSGFIVETECYLGNIDPASHSYQGKCTRRNEPMFMTPGTSYVYSIYGMYHCFNISSKEKGSCVLIRALEPYENLEEMEIYRQARRKSNFKKLKFTELCSGPSKLCQALNINKENCNKIDLSQSSEFWVEDGVKICEENIVISKRIGIESAGEESVNKLLRFYVLRNSCVSVKDKKAENEINNASNTI